MVIKPELCKISKFCSCDVYCFEVNPGLLKVQIPSRSASCFGRSKLGNGTKHIPDTGCFWFQYMWWKRPKTSVI